jgi:hypothetical protein
MTRLALTANDLHSGEVVFWAAGRWIARFPDAELFADPGEAEAPLAAAKAQPTVVVEPYLIEVADSDGYPAPTSFRERVRALGPTIHPEMGKQAEGGPAIEAIRAQAGGARSSGRLGLIRLKK